MFTFSKSIRSSQLFKLYSTSLQNGPQDSFTVQYLITQFGLSKEKAVSASSKRHLNFESLDKPNSVISLFKTQGFSGTQIQRIVEVDPSILSSHPQNTLLPKIQFFRSKGFQVKDVPRIFSCLPATFRRSLENCIVPSFNFIADFLGSERNAVIAISSHARIILDLDFHVKPNIDTLLGSGVPQSAVAYLLRTRPFMFVYDVQKLKESVKQARDMGMDPRSYNFCMALNILTTTRKSTFNKKMEDFKRWGCSEEDVLRSFKSCPNILKISEERFNRIMSLFVHEIGWESSEVVKRYFMFSLSLNKRMIPRWSVYQELLSKGLVKTKYQMSTMFRMREDIFVEKFINCYKNEAPSLLKLYIEKQAAK